MSRESGALSRRNLIVGAGAAAAAAAAASYSAPSALSLLPGRSGAGAPNLWHRQYWTLENAGPAEWTRLLGLPFRISGGGHVRWVTLVRVDALPSPGKRPDNVGRKTGFSVLFEARQALPFGQERIYEILHRRYGAMPVFLEKPNPRRMRAIFN